VTKADLAVNAAALSASTAMATTSHSSPEPRCPTGKSSLTDEPESFPKCSPPQLPSAAHHRNPYSRTTRNTDISVCSPPRRRINCKDCSPRICGIDLYCRLVSVILRFGMRLLRLELWIPRLGRVLRSLGRISRGESLRIMSIVS